MKCKSYVLTMMVLMSGSLYAEKRCINGKFQYCVPKLYEEMEKEHRTGELSKDFMYVKECIEKKDYVCDQETLQSALKDLQSHGMYTRPKLEALGGDTPARLKKMLK